MSDADPRDAAIAAAAAGEPGPHFYARPYVHTTSEPGPALCARCGRPASDPVHIPAEPWP